jgi:hypothetical protein
VEGTPLFKFKSTTAATKHIHEQQEIIRKLNELGYYARICVGFDQAKEMIDGYFANYFKKII